MGCGKSKHAVVTETTIVKSTKSDDGKETRTTKTVTEKGDSISIQEVETTSSVVEDTKKETTTTKIDPIGTANVGASSPASISEELAKEDVKDSDVDTVKEDKEVNDVVPASIEGVKEDLKDDEKKESTTTDEKEAKTENVTPATLVLKDVKKLKDSKEELDFETPMKTTNDEFSTPKVQDVAPPKQSTKVETKKEEDVKVTGADNANAETSPATEPKKVTTADEANAAETKEKET